MKRARHLMVSSTALALATLVLFPAACVWRGAPSPSVLVIFVENLGFSSFSCSEETESGRSSGLQTFCNQGVRFTHAYTPSTMSQSSIGSIFTALEPYEHGLRHNGAQTLPAKYDTVAEVALSRGFRTSFFSGGPPVWRRSGLGQGFEVFDDNFAIGLKSIYRPASEVVRLFLNWQATEASNHKFFSFLFFSDLQFIDTATMNEFGEERESSFVSQLTAVDEALARLIKEMKRRKIWDTTDVFLIGLQADPPVDRFGEIPAMNLFSEATRVTLIIKPSRKARDGDFNWKIDANVSLTDVGATLYELVGAPLSKNRTSAESLKEALTSPQPSWPPDRMIVSESAWGEWRGIGPVRASVRQGPYLFIFDEEGMLFNTLTDSLELNPLPYRDENAKTLRARYANYLRAKGFIPWRIPSRRELERSLLARELWRVREPSLETIRKLKDLSNEFEDDEILLGWRAIWALRLADWNDLKEASLGPIKKPVWEYVARRNLAEKATVPDGPCFEFLKAPKALANPRLEKDCRVEGLTELLAWANETSSEASRIRAMDQFLRFYTSKALASRIAEQNHAGGFRWDTVAMANEPDIIDLLLALPEFRRYRALVKARTASLY